MLGKFFSAICIIAFVISIITGQSAQMSSAVLDGAARSVEVTLTLIGVMSLWTGILEVFRDAGIIGKFARLLSFPMKLIFPTASKIHRGIDSAVACISANLLGIGNAATPSGIEALREFQNGSDVATDDSIMLTVLNTSSFSIIPTTVFALRRAAGASMLFELLPAIWLSGMIGTACAVFFVKIFALIDRRLHRDN